MSALPAAIPPIAPTSGKEAADRSTIAERLARADARLVIDPVARLSERLARLVADTADADLVLAVSAGSAYREAAGRCFGMELAERLRLDEDSALALSTAVHEATINAAVHGALGLRMRASEGDCVEFVRHVEAVEHALAVSPAAADAIVLIARARNDHVEVAVCDDGNGFSVDAAARYGALNGRGIGLIRRLTRETAYLDRGRICAMVFALPPAEGPHGVDAEAAPSTGEFDVTGGRVLVVDDEPVNARLIETALGSAGYREIRVAASGMEALTMASAWRPDLVLLDMRMPGIDGIETCRRLRGLPETAQAPIIMQTASGASADRTAAFAAGVSDFVTKPLHIRELLARVGLHLQNRATIAHLEEIQRKLGRELAEARRIQQGLLPDAADIARWERLARTRLAAEWRCSSMLGGDVWGLCNAPDRPPGLFLADFSGHGIGAALHASVLCREIQRHWPLARSPADMLGRLNRELAGVWTDACFAAVTIIEIGDDELRYATAGAPPPRCQAPNGAWEILPARGLPVGVLATATYVDHAVAFSAGHRLLAHTDGLSELRTHGGQLAEEGMLDSVLATCTAPGPVVALRRLMHEIGTHADPVLTDDLTAIWLDRL